ncbi:MAG: HEAT repeat domain-containing protein [Candidatus Delongbacteria bacterium]|nr:HEAT repeat domain-containing protein [Candidatus Delongbacteria bacterium]
MKYLLLTLLTAALLLSANEYQTSKYDTLFIKASASYHNHQKYVEPARLQIIELGEEIMPFLVEQVGSRQPREYHAMRDLFGRIDSKNSSRYLMDKIRLMDKKTYGTAVEFLGRSGYKKGLEFLAPFLQEDSTWIKLSTLKGIGDLKDPASLKYLRPFKEDNDFKIRWHTAAALGKINTIEADRELVSMLNDSLQLVSHTALHYLDNHLKKDSVGIRFKVISRTMDSPLIKLLQQKYIENKVVDLISEKKIETSTQDTIKLMTINDLVSDNSVIYNALGQIYMDKNDYFLPVKTEKELFLFPSVAEMFEDPMKQISVPEKTKDDYKDFPNIDFSNLSQEFNASTENNEIKEIDLNIFTYKAKEVQIIFDKTWEKYPDMKKIIDKISNPVTEERSKETADKSSDGLEDDDISVMIRSRLNERKYSEESKKFYKETLKDIQLQYIIEAGISSYTDFLGLLEHCKKNKLEATTMDTSLGRIAVGTDGDDIYEGEYFLIIDQVGNDTYKLDNSKNRFNYIIDLKGNDRYISAEYGPASTFNGISLLYEGEGDDIYECTNNSLAFAEYGFAVLLEAGGNDKYLSLKSSQASASFGYACLWDNGGNDVYLGEEKTQAFAGVSGYSVLVDENGNDNYTLSGTQVDVLRYSDHFISMGQGFSIGDRDNAAGGMAFLFDKQGNDNYISDIFGQGGAYWFALGVLYDFKGNDNYISYQYSIGSGVHLAFGTVIDLEGDDSYKSKGVSIGCGHDYAGGMFFDLKGNDSYQAESLSIGAGNADAISIFFDGQGDDLYGAHQANTMGWSDWRRDTGYISLFIEMSGNDKYGSAFGANNQKWYQATWGVGMDFDFKVR